jgi:ketosteroid isomerase-like protein
MYRGHGRAATIHRVGNARHTDVSRIDARPRVHDLSVEEEIMLTMLDAFFEEGWNRHDVDRLMTFMTDDCVFETAGGPDVCGARHAGRERVREAFARVFTAFPDAAFHGARHFVAGDRGVSEWTFTGTGDDGQRVEVNGCDLFTFARGKIAVKSSYFKNRRA